MQRKEKALKLILEFERKKTLRKKEGEAFRTERRVLLLLHGGKKRKCGAKQRSGGNRPPGTKKKGPP